jgi:hypothetical protein
MEERPSHLGTARGPARKVDNTLVIREPAAPECRHSSSEFHPRSGSQTGTKACAIAGAPGTVHA